MKTLTVIDPEQIRSGDVIDGRTVRGAMRDSNTRRMFCNFTDGQRSRMFRYGNPLEIER